MNRRLKEIGEAEVKAAFLVTIDGKKTESSLICGSYEEQEVLKPICLDVRLLVKKALDERAPEEPALGGADSESCSG